MMKKVILAILVLFFCLPTNNYKVNAEESNASIEFSLNGTSGLLMDALSGQIIIAKNIDQKLFPASMTKMMGMYLVMESLKTNTIKKDQLVSISAKAASMGGSQIYLEAGEEMTVNDLFKSVCIASANDAMYALGETISGTNNLFVQLMNTTAKKLGMNNTNFVNVAGYDDPNHYTTARDMAILARVLVLNYGDEILPYTSMLEGYVRENTSDPFWLVNTNKLINSYPGMDGLKTGFTNKSLYCLTATASRDNLRFIAVSMNNKTIKERSEDITSLLDYGFANYKCVKLYTKGEIVASTVFENAKEKESKLLFNQDVYVTVRKSAQIEDINQSYTFTVRSAPIKAMQTVGVLTIINEDGWSFKYEFVVASQVTLLKWYHYFFIRLKDIIF